jgi:hypothetical protein
MQPTNPEVSEEAAKARVEALWNAAQHLAVTMQGASAARAALHLEALRVVGATWSAEGAFNEPARRALGLDEAAAARVVALLQAPAGAADPGEAEALHRRMLEELTSARRQAERARSRVLTRRGFVVVALLAGVVAARPVVLRLLAPADLAEGKAWTASSSLAECHPERGECAGVRTFIKFHTREEPSPWYQVDLGAPTPFSRVRVVNRGDGAEARAIPLVVEVSDDGVTFREVARQPELFHSWEAVFPVQTARYVRVRVDRQTWLHLEAVTVHR